MIIMIIDLYELPIVIEDFFAFLGKKEEITFLDFCCLLRLNKENSEIFLKSVTGNLYSNSNCDNGTSLFPIEVRKKQCIFKF